MQKQLSDCCTPGGKTAPGTAEPAAAITFRIPTLDCSVEESEIRRVVEPIAGIRGLHFQLPRRTLRIDASEDALPKALAAIRKAGFAPEQVQSHNTVDGDSPLDDHDQGSSGYLRLAAALAVALAAEAISYFAPDTRVWTGVGMAVAAVAIWLAGWEAQHQRADVGRRYGRIPDRPMARSRHGDGAVCDCRTH
jgi:Cd2+/Zn2+-exporting ATPase